MQMNQFGFFPSCIAMPVRTPPVARKGIQNCVTYEIFGGSFTIAAEKITVYSR